MSKQDDKWAEAKRKAQRLLETMTDEEDAKIRAGALRDPDNPPLTDEIWARMRPVAEGKPEFLARWRNWRGKQKAPVKKLVSLRLDPDVIDHFRATGPGWQGRINDTLRKAARLRSPAKAAQTKPASVKRPAKAAAR